jgi:hypothetical protein
MKSARITALRILSLLLLLPGLAGLILSAVTSAHYLQTLPHWPVPEESRMIPRDIHGVAVYQTPEENHYLNRIEYSSVAFLVAGAALGMIYLEKWSGERSKEAEENSHLVES